MASTPTSKTGLFIGSALGALPAVIGGAGGSFSAGTLAKAMLVLGLIQILWNSYNQVFQVTPNGAVAATLTDGGNVVAGPAVAIDTGASVDLTKPLDQAGITPADPADGDDIAGVS